MLSVQPGSKPGRNCNGKSRVSRVVPRVGVCYNGGKFMVPVMEKQNVVLGYSMGKAGGYCNANEKKYP